MEVFLTAVVLITCSLGCFFYGRNVGISRGVKQRNNELRFNWGNNFEDKLEVFKSLEHKNQTIKREYYGLCHVVGDMIHNIASCWESWKTNGVLIDNSKIVEQIGRRLKDLSKAKIRNDVHFAEKKRDLAGMIYNTTGQKVNVIDDDITYLCLLAENLIVGKKLNLWYKGKNTVKDMDWIEDHNKKTTNLQSTLIKDKCLDGSRVVSEIIGTRCFVITVKGEEGGDGEYQYAISVDPFTTDSELLRLNFMGFEGYFKNNFGKKEGVRYFDTVYEATFSLLKAWYLWNNELEDKQKVYYKENNYWVNQGEYIQDIMSQQSKGVRI